MCIGEFATSEASLAEQPLETAIKKPPPKRLITAKADAVLSQKPGEPGEPLERQGNAMTLGSRFNSPMSSPSVQAASVCRD